MELRQQFMNFGAGSKSAASCSDYITTPATMQVVGTGLMNRSIDAKSTGLVFLGHRVEAGGSGLIGLATTAKCSSVSFNFSGRIGNTINHRRGQFQYRYGHKVQPRDHYLCSPAALESWGNSDTKQTHQTTSIQCGFSL